MSDQPQRPASDEDRDGWKAYWAALGMEWRTEPEIDEGRQRYLAERRATTVDIDRGIYPFTKINLSRSDVEWLLATQESRGVVGPVQWAHELDKPKVQRRAGLDLRGANLRGVDLTYLPLTRIRGGLQRGERINRGPRQRSLAGAHFLGADLSHASLDHSILAFAHFEGANLFQAALTGSTLNRTHLEAANLFEANLGGAKLRYAFFDVTSSLSGLRLTDPDEQLPRLHGVHWGGADLSEVDWGQLRILGEEENAKKPPTGATRAQRAGKRLVYYDEAVRAARQLSKALREQGLKEEADRYAYRAQRLQRLVLRLKRRYVAVFGSWCLDFLAGYGYRPGQAVSVYLLLIAAFTVAYFGLGLTVGPQLSPLGALVFSVTSFHGRGFFPGGSPGHSVTLDDPMTVLAAAEAVVGLIVEISFIATFTNRFFAR